MINAKINCSIDVIKIDLEMDLLTTRMGIVGIMEFFFVLHRLKEKTSYKITLIANQEAINLTTLLSADPTTDLRPVLRPMNKIFRRTIIRHHLILTTTDDTITELSDLCPFNYQSLRSRTTTNLEIQGLA